jgi:hypothetical protein
MPRTAIATGCVDQVLPLENIAGVLCSLVGHARASAVEGGSTPVDS